MKAINFLSLVFTIIVALPAWGQSPAQRDFKVADELQRDGAYEDAERKWSAFLSQYPRDAQASAAQYCRGVCLYQLEKNREAKKVFDELLKTQDKKFPNRDFLLYYSGVNDKIMAESNPSLLKSAQNNLETLLKEYPQSSAFTNGAFRLAQIYQITNQSPLAYKLYTRIWKERPDCDEAPRAFIETGRGLLEQGQYASCSRLMKEFPQRWKDNPSRFEASFVAGEALFLLKDYQQAEKEYDKASSSQIPGIQDYPSADLALYNRGNCMWMLGKYAQSAALYEEFTTRFPQSAMYSEAVLSAGESYLTIDNREKAKKFLLEAAEEAKTAARANLDLADLFLQENDISQAIERINKTPPETFCCLPNASETEQTVVRNACMLRARIYSRSDSVELFQKAIKQCDEICKRWEKSPSASVAMYLSANIAFQMKDYLDCLGRSQKTQQLWPGSVQAREAQVLEANCLFVTSQFENSSEVFFRLYSNNPADSRRYNWLVNAMNSYDNIKRFDKVKEIVLSEFKKCSEPKIKAELTYLLAKSLFELKEYQNAKKVLDNCRKSYPDYPKMDCVLFLIGQINLQDKENEKAIAVFETLVSQYPNSSLKSAAQYNLAQITSVSGDIQTALQQAEEVISMPKDNRFRPRAILDSAALLYKNGMYVQSIEKCTLYLTDYPQLPDSVEAYYMRALCQTQTKEYEKAINDCQHGLEIAKNKKLPENWEIRLRIAEITALAQFPDRASEAVDSCRLLMDLRKTLQKPLPDEDAFMFIYADILYRGGNKDKAKQWYEYVYKKYPQSSHRWACAWSLGMYAEAEKNIPLAKNFYTESAAGSDLAAAIKSMYRLGWILFSEKSYDQALGYFNRIAESEKSMDNFISSSDSVSTIISDAAFMRAECLFYQKKFAEALVEYNKLNNDVSPANLPIFADNAAKCAIEIADYPAAEAVLNRLLDENNALRSDQPEEVKALLPALQFNRAMIFVKTQKTAQAEALFDRIAKENKDTNALDLPEVSAMAIAKSWFYLGEFKFQKKMYREAIPLYYNVIFGYSFPELQAESCYEAARCFEALKQTKQAEKQYQRILDKFPNSAKAEIARKKLNQGKKP